MTASQVRRALASMAVEMLRRAAQRSLPSSLCRRRHAWTEASRLSQMTCNTPVSTAGMEAVALGGFQHSY